MFKFNVWLSVNYKFHSNVWVNAESEEEARRLVDEHLCQRKPLGFSERETRKRNSKRTPWIPGLQIMYVSRCGTANRGDLKGVVCD